MVYSSVEGKLSLQWQEMKDKLKMHWQVKECAFVK